MPESQTQQREAAGPQSRNIAGNASPSAGREPGDRGPDERADERSAGARVRAGDWVEVRSKAEILATLDQRGRLDDMPFMPEMFPFCGQRFKVFKRAHKTCDTVSGTYLGRLLPDGVHLDLRCDGKAHGGCQAGCLFFWKEAWLKPANAAGISGGASAADVVAPPTSPPGCTEQDVAKAVHQPDSGSPPRYSCQATELVSYTKPLDWWDPRQYAEDYKSGNVSLTTIAQVISYGVFMFWTRANSERYGKPGRWLYDHFQAVVGGQSYPRYKGTIPVGTPTPRVDLGLEAGDWVRVKSYEEIRKTLDTAGANRRMGFDAELVPYCGKVFQVRTRVERFIDEPTGVFKTMKTPAVILEGVYCLAHYSHYRLLCPRAIYSWWRESWLERVESPMGTQAQDAKAAGLKAG